jgi:hypothetical protein
VRCETIWQEVNKLLKAGFIRPVSYLSWLANPVLVEKADDSWRMCIDYTSLNKACLKDKYSLPRIYKIVDSMMSCELLLFFMLIQAIIRTASPLTMKKKQYLSLHLESSAILRWRSGWRTGELYNRSAFISSLSLKLGEASKLILMM